MLLHMTKQVLSRPLSKYASPCTHLKPAAEYIPNARMLIVTLLTLVALAAAEAIPPSASTSFGNRPFPDGSCSFTLWQRRQFSSTYIQLNTIRDLANDITVDVAAQRPATAFNSYTRLDENYAFAVTGLLDDKDLVITHLRGDELAFRVGEVEWSTQSFWRRKGPSGNWKRAACSAGAWEDSAEARVCAATSVKMDRKLT